MVIIVRYSNTHKLRTLLMRSGFKLIGIWRGFSSLYRVALPSWGCYIQQAQVVGVYKQKQ